MTNIVTIDDLQQGYLRIQRSEISVHEWCEMHRAYDTLSVDSEKKDKSSISINDLIFPHTDLRFYQEIARHILTTDTGIDQKHRDDAIQSHKKKASEIFDKLRRHKVWKKVIEKIQINLSDKIVLDGLKMEIDDPMIHCKDLYWLTSWYLRFCFATSNPRWNRWFFEDEIGFYEWSLTIHYTGAYKNKSVFELMLSSLPSKLSQELMSLTVLNNTVMTEIDRYIVSRTIPFTIPVSRFDILELISCGIFPVNIVSRTIIEVDGCPMGSTFPFHDILHAATYIAPSMVCLRKTPYDEQTSRKLSFGLTSAWYIYNSYVIKCVEIANVENWSDQQKDILFLNVHELMSSAYGSFATILHSPLETGKKLREYDENNIASRNRLTGRQSTPYPLDEYVTSCIRIQEIFTKYFLQTVTETSRNNQNCLQLQHEIFLRWVAFNHSASNVLNSDMFVDNFDKTPSISVPIEKQHLTKKLLKDATQLYGMIVRFIPDYPIPLPQYATLDDVLLREHRSIDRLDKSLFFEASIIDT
jgi:hypothetical protein